MLLKKKRTYKWCPCSNVLFLDKRRRVRCPICNRRLLPQELKYEGGIGYRIPPHKTYKDV